MTWALVAVIAVVTLGVYELAWRAYGYEPSIADRMSFWADERRQAREHSPSIAIVGTSRIQTSLDPRVLEEYFSEHRVHNLAINGSDPYRMLEDLARDPAFEGVVIYDVLPWQLFASHTTENERSITQGLKRTKRNLDYLESQAWIAALETRLSRHWQQTTVLALREVNPKVVASRLLLHGSPHPQYIRMRSDRLLMADLSRVDRSTDEQGRTLEQMRSSRLGRRAFNARIAQMNEWVKLIQARGGSVVFYRSMSTGELRAKESQVFPRHLFWNHFSRRIDGHTLHFEDVDWQQTFWLPDGHHMHFDDTSNYSHRVGEELADMLTKHQQAR